MTTDVQASMQVILEAYYRDTLGLPDWEAAVARRLQTGLEGQVNRLASFVDLRGKHILDVGCGFGDVMLSLLEAGAEQATGIDPDLTWLTVAAARGSRDSKRFRVNRAVGEQLPFRDNSFDLVCSNFVVEHVDDLELVVGEMIRVLKPGGLCLINCPNYLWPMEPHYHLPWAPYTPKWIGQQLLRWLGRDPHYFVHHIHYLTPFDVLKALRQAGVTHTTNLLHATLTRPDLIVNLALRTWARRLSFLRPPSSLIYLLMPSASILAAKPGEGEAR